MPMKGYEKPTHPEPPKRPPMPSQASPKAKPKGR